MEIFVKRVLKGEKYTIGRMYINGNYVCDTLEDVVRDLGKNGEGKIYGETAIPAGIYKVVRHYTPKFGNCLWILEVPHFKEILIHSGNTAKDTKGCILVGKNNEIGKVLYSRDTLKKVMGLVGKSNNITIQIE